MIKLNLGSGYKRIDGYLNIDSDPLCNPDHLLNLETDRLPFDDNSVDEVLCHHILEHIGDGFFHLLKELYRVCKDGAILDIAVPHPKHDVFLIDPTHKRPIYSDTIDMFSKKRNQRTINNNGTETTLGIINDIDIEVFAADYVLDDQYQKLFQTLPNEQCDMIARSYNNVIIEILIKAMIIK